MSKSMIDKIIEEHFSYPDNFQKKMNFKCMEDEIRQALKDIARAMVLCYTSQDPHFNVFGYDFDKTVFGGMCRQQLERYKEITGDTFPQDNTSH